MSTVEIFFIVTASHEFTKQLEFDSSDIAQSVKCFDVDQKVGDSTPFCATIFLPKIVACWHMSLQVETHNQNNCCVTEQIEYCKRGNFRVGVIFAIIAILPLRNCKR